ncbi:biotin--[acetyl-CoA-carboxylase] ligase [Nocardioides zeae]|uniref:biotin--[biotin carboxyl-carrier protein] ligase n=1 Tax=Nocardioides imazamoxiresistens TaxID=3231893 RepID=A0ABU3PTZ3_9ACTN|nr:biotin--[acetyl-CoA-carboxylase] ligase [Nocardioides zeae]MDT9592702.1 biotin--[acetyl-CoA-carboxylase] ligase [Nocardioides zeae]
MTSAADRPPIRTEELEDLSPWRVQVVAASGSTNADLAARARAGAPAATVLVAEHQTAGRGRIDRTFVTPDRAALTFSVLLRPDVAPSAWPWLPLAAGLAVRAGTRARHPELDVRLKWPNDVLVHGADGVDRKVCGILAERVETPAGAAAVLGIGVNVSTRADELPVPTACSLLTAGAPEATLDRTALLRAVLAELASVLDLWQGGEQGALRGAYAAACTTVGQAVRVVVPAGEPLEGEAVDVDADGRLVVRSGGRDHAVSAGDVVHVRRA